MRFANQVLPKSMVVVAAHPDDETISASAQMAKFGRQCTLVHTTDGAPRNPRFFRAAGCRSRAEYAALRRQELMCAIREVGLVPEQCLSMCYPDQETTSHLAELTARVSILLEQLQPAYVLTHPYEGGHPDHDATAFAVHHALKLWDPNVTRRPTLLEFASYHQGPEGLVTLNFLPCDERQPETATTLDSDQVARKLRMYHCYRSQREVLHAFPVRTEKLRQAPSYDFTRAPHTGRLHYESFDWQISGEEFRSAVRSALGSLNARDVL